LLGFYDLNPIITPRIWEVASLCRAVADFLETRFNPVAVRGEISSFTRASSGHCYFTLKDPAGQNNGQIRCAMFRRAAGLMDFSPQEGMLVEVRGRIDVYAARGELQLVIESMQRAGQGTLFEQFLKVKARLEQEGLFAAERKRALPVMPHRIGVVTSLGAAALADVIAALRRRAPHIPVVIANAAVQGPAAPAELIGALQALYADNDALDVILLVRGGGSLDDLMAFNDERLARVLAQSPVPIVSGVGHETDFTIADFVADHRAATPTAAAEMAVLAQSESLELLDAIERHLTRAMERRLDREQQRLDSLAAQMARPSHLLAGWEPTLNGLTQRLRQSVNQHLKQLTGQLAQAAQRLPTGVAIGLRQHHHALAQLATRMEAADPQRVLDRGYAWVTDEEGRVICTPASLKPQQPLNLRLAKGQIAVRVQ
jgi:exodeoxyribonuclease VII large subunit